MKNLVIFDLDETCIDSRHRTPNNPDGSLNLKKYLALQTPENIARDTLLPLARIMQQRRAQGDYIIILTARGMIPADYEFLKTHGLHADKILSRNNIKKSHYDLSDGAYKLRHIKKFLNLKQFRKMPVIMFDDARPVKSTLRQFFPVLCGHKINARLSK